MKQGPNRGMVSEYTWQDVLDLVYYDAGLGTEEEIRMRGELAYKGKGIDLADLPPSEVVIRVTMYDDDYNTRLDKQMRAE